MSAHTKGPWRINTYTSAKAGRAIEAQALDGSWKYVVDRVRGGSPSETEANARLIVAAPELLDVVKQCLAERTDVAARSFGVHKDDVPITNDSIVDPANFDFTDENWREHAPDELELVLAMRAVIAKAEGRLDQTLEGPADGARGDAETNSSEHDGRAPQSIGAPLSKCCGAFIEDAGECSDGCCDRMRCSQCGKTWLCEVPQ